MLTTRESVHLNKQIEDQKKLINELENKTVPYDPTKGRWDEYNRQYEIHQVSIRDAFWKRRILIAILENLDLCETAKVY